MAQERADASDELANELQTLAALSATSRVSAEAKEALTGYQSVLI
ncbi:hypothetical protein GCM10017044_01050 [Kordiimonas sediminis]|uniref:Uncharacterized protein n=1 Tax=Kordiimonas sediminis TaxID=1735581 RepID=A0A919AJ45_9PROT|nr:hypothetical protein [Kordiimonas sediminis]GHF11136.1 hypothetical protein GCM10017044_01050 [Kordiimonas sediminis]